MSSWRGINSETLKGPFPQFDDNLGLRNMICMAYGCVEMHATTTGQACPV